MENMCLEQPQVLFVARLDPFVAKFSFLEIF